MRIVSYWAKYSDNFGDIMTPYIIGRMGVNVVWTNRNKPRKLLAIGTLMSYLRPMDTVWGTGAIPYERGPNRGMPYTIPEGVKILAVRGPMTRGLFNAAQQDLVPEIYGDPGILMPSHFFPKIEKKYKVGIIPHEVEKDVPVIKDPSVLWIDINAGVEAVVISMLQCESIMSSSLHGIIGAEAYGIPTVWVRMSNKIGGGGFKFKDYYRSTDRNPPPVVMWEDSRTLRKTDNALRLPSKEHMSNLKDGLIKAFRKNYRAL